MSMFQWQTQKLFGTRCAAVLTTCLFAFLATVTAGARFFYRATAVLTGWSQAIGNGMTEIIFPRPAFLSTPRVSRQCSCTCITVLLSQCRLRRATVLAELGGRCWLHTGNSPMGMQGRLRCGLPRLRRHGGLPSGLAVVGCATVTPSRCRLKSLFAGFTTDSELGIEPSGHGFANYAATCESNRDRTPTRRKKILTGSHKRISGLGHT